MPFNGFLRARHIRIGLGTDLCVVRACRTLASGVEWGVVFRIFAAPDLEWPLAGEH